MRQAFTKVVYSECIPLTTPVSKTQFLMRFFVENEYVKVDVLRVKKSKKGLLNCQGVQFEEVERMTVRVERWNHW